LGRARMPLGKALSMPLGAVVDLDRSADAPVDLFVNGLRFAQGHLVLTDDGEWAVCVDEVTGPLQTPSRHRLPRRPVASELEDEQPSVQADVEAEAVEVEDEAPVQEAVEEETAAEEQTAAEETAVEAAEVETPEPATETDVEDAPEPVQAE